MKFVSLHGHTSFSTGDGHGSPDAHVERVKELGMSCMAITEHGTTSSHAQFEKACKKHGIKPIFGVEAYVAEPESRSKFHQTILALNQQGYRQINRLVTRSYSEGFYGKPTVHFEWLTEKKDTSDLLILSGCASSYLSKTICANDWIGENALTPEEMEEHYVSNVLPVVDWYTSNFGDRFYLETQRFYNFDKTIQINRMMERIASERGLPVVGTADVHYPTFDGWKINQIANAIAWGKTLVEMEEGDRDYSALPGQTYPTSDVEMVTDLMKAGLSKSKAIEAVKNTIVISERCENYDLPKSPPVRYSESDGTNAGAAKILKQRIIEGVDYRKNTDPAFAEDFEARRGEYIARLTKELNVIIPKGFSDYFLINQQIIGWAKDNGIVVGPGRGSAAGSLVCYLLRLTEINPMLYPLMLFERFLDPGREDDPDIDTDYQDDRRGEVFDFARKVYGLENVGNIGNFSRYRGKMAIKDVGRVTGVPFNDLETYADLVLQAPAGDPREFKTAEDTAASFADAQAIVDRYPELKRAFDLEGDMKTLGIHAAGMVISNIPISETCAIYKRTKSNGEEAEVIAFDKRDAAYLGMLKLDCLGLSTMTIISDVLKMLSESPVDGMELLTLEKLYAMPFDDPVVLQGFAEDDLTGIFQFEGRATRNIVKNIFLGKDKVPTFMQLADINALSRPGSLSSGMTGRYIKVENGEKPRTIHPVVDEILSETNGCLVYQEQVMKIGSVFGGLSDHEIGRLRKIIGAKQQGGAFEEFWEKFKDGAEKLHGASESKAREVWEYMAASSSYLFNVAHAISYAAIAYWTMYLKTYYPAEFFAASLRNASKKGKIRFKADPTLLVLQDAVAHGLTVTPPHPQLSRSSWWANAEHTGVIAGFSQISGVGLKTAELMETRRVETSGAVDWNWFTQQSIRFGKKAAEKAAELQGSDDPFKICLTSDAIRSVSDAILSGDVPELAPPNVTASNMASKEGEDVVYLGHVVAVKLINVIDELRKRENLTHEEARAKTPKPELDIKAKIICADLSGNEVHVNVSRYQYPKLASEIISISPKGIFVVHATGKASTEYGAAIQARDLVAIEMEE